MSEPSRDPQQLAEWWPRVGATLLDLLIAGVLAFAAVIVAALMVAPFGENDDATGALWLLLWIVFGTAYSGLMARKGANNGQTLGKQAAGIRVVRDDGRPMTFGTAVLRDVLLKFIVGNLVFGIGWIVDSLWPLGERENRALHDLAASTHVVNTKPTPRPQIQRQPRPVAQQPVLAPAIARHVDAARRIQAGIGAAVQRAQLPYTEVSREVDALMGLLWNSAQRAQMLHEALEETPVSRVEGRLSALESGQHPELADALREQLIVQRRMQGQLEHYDAELERIVVELDTVRSNLISVSASGDTANQERLAGAVRELRDEMSAVAEGMDQAYRP